MRAPTPGDYDPWWDVTAVWADGRTETKRMRRSEVSIYLVSIPPQYLAAFSAAFPPDSENLEAEKRDAPPE